MFINDSLEHFDDSPGQDAKRINIQKRTSRAVKKHIDPRFKMPFLPPVEDKERDFRERINNA